MFLLQNKLKELAQSDKIAKRRAENLAREKKESSKNNELDGLLEDLDHKR